MKPAGSIVAAERTPGCRASGPRARLLLRTRPVRAACSCRPGGRRARRQREYRPKPPRRRVERVWRRVPSGASAEPNGRPRQIHHDKSAEPPRQARQTHRHDVADPPREPVRRSVASWCSATSSLPRGVRAGGSTRRACGGYGAKRRVGTRWERRASPCDSLCPPVSPRGTAAGRRFRSRQGFPGG